MAALGIPMIAEVTPRFFRFLIAGGFGAACYMIGSHFLVLSGVEAWIASVSVYAFLVPIVYSLQKNFVFESNRSHFKSFPRYLIIQLIGLMLSATIPFLLGKLGISPSVSFFCVILVITFTNYGLQSRWAFSPRDRMEKEIEIDR
jgi:putative flippase GtrA